MSEVEKIAKRVDWGDYSVCSAVFTLDKWHETHFHGRSNF